MLITSTSSFVRRPFGVHLASVGRVALIPLAFLRGLFGFDSRHPLHSPLPFTLSKVLMTMRPIFLGPECGISKVLLGGTHVNAF